MLYRHLRGRRESSLVTVSRYVLWFPVVGIAVVGVALFLPELTQLLGTKLVISVLSGLLYKDKVDILLTFVIATFAIVEGYSTFVQVTLDQRRNIIEDVRNELEKAYGPLYSILSRLEELLPVDGRSEELRVSISVDEKNLLDKIMMTYPFMFPPDVVALWRVNVQPLKPYSLARILDYTAPPSNFAIPLKFKNRIEEEYNRRVEEYYEATGRKKELENVPRWAR